MQSTRELSVLESAISSGQVKCPDEADPVLSPNHEPIVLAMKPLDGTFANNAQKHGVAGLNVDGARVGTEGGYTKHTTSDGAKRDRWEGNTSSGRVTEHGGRFPANVIHDGSEEVLEHLPDAPGQQGEVKGTEPGVESRHVYGNYTGQRKAMKPRDGEATSNKRYTDVGSTNFAAIPGQRRAATSAARFFYCAKADKAERGESNNHPTVKPLDLMSYLCKLVSMPGYGGILLDPFAGSGSTLLAGSRWFGQVIGIEREERYCEIAANRCSKTLLF
jgi:site-specific DNA-methyltransferase (adenine-specific)